MTVEAEITETANAPVAPLIADGLCMVDGLAIYRMEGFGIALVPCAGRAFEMAAASGMGSGLPTKRKIADRR